MYTRLKNVQILIALLKKHGIRHIVLSAGQSNYNFVHSVETDDYFNCYSVVDERSAAFFALGLSQELHEPVVINCTASTACSNYLSAVTEAYYQGIPLVVITSNKDIRELGQMKLLSIRQDNIFENVCKKEVQLPEINSEKDVLYCQRMINEALLEINHNGTGPVHIDVPSYGNNCTVDVPELPSVRAVFRHSVFDNLDNFKRKLINKKVLVICGQGYYDNETQRALKAFSEKYNCVIGAEHMANIKLDNAVNINLLMISPTHMTDNICPDILITLGNHIMDPIWNKLKFYGGPFEHWLVNESGSLIDPCDKLTDIFQGSANEFFRKMNDTDLISPNSFYTSWYERTERMTIPKTELCHISTIKALFDNLPEEGIIHYSIYNSIRISQHFKLPKGFTAYANMGALGIDGCLSSFLGQAYITEKPAFLIIGDLSFFYDMNALKIRHKKENIHILMLNNHGGAEFYQNNGYYDELGLHTSPHHNNSAEGWAKENGFEYFTASTLKEVEEIMPQFASSSLQPKFFEVKTDLITDMNALKEMNRLNNLTIKK
jgi:2-succinyl-5-enolpyruvyl-6-hydroxy-3-cyclohexene-1-carboxylate synthase